MWGSVKWRVALSDKYYCDKGCREQEGYYLRRTGGTHKA